MACCVECALKFQAELAMRMTHWVQGPLKSLAPGWSIAHALCPQLIIAVFRGTQSVRLSICRNSRRSARRRTDCEGKA
jgi:hypothetical protein